MKKVFCFCFLCLISCKENIEEYYPDGSIKISIQTDENGIPDGEYLEYYNSGEIKVKGVYKKGMINDTVYYFYENGKLKEKGIMKDKEKYGWWDLYNPNEILINKTEYYSVNNKKYRNQWIDFKENGDTIFSSSNFYKLYVPDTLSLGKNVGKIKYYSSSKFEKNFYEISIDNQISETRIDRDTFPQEQDITRFGIYAHKTGFKEIKGSIIETIFEINEITKDSISAKQLKRVVFFQKKVYVK